MKNRQKGQKRNRGFTLMEMVLVLAIIGILVGLGAYSAGDFLKGAKEDKIFADLRSLETALIRFNSRAGFYPTTEQGLRALVEMPTSGPKPGRWSPTMKESGIIDPFKNPYQYRVPGVKSGEAYDIFSMGEDGMANTEDDIGNWMQK